MAEENKDFKYFVRIAKTDLDGNKSISMALLKIKGIGFMLSNAICNVAGIDHRKKAGTMSDEEAKKIDDILDDPSKFNIPVWMFNRRRDFETGQDMHITTSNLIFAQENDVKIMKKTRSYKGMRHSFGLPVRGQKTKANFRKNKGKSSLGVKKKVASKAGKT